MKKFNFLSKIIKEEVEEVLTETGSGYSRLVRAIMGIEPNINSIGLLTAENPNAEQTKPEINNNLNKKLFKDLKMMGYGPIKIKGKYGNMERSFAVPNIDYDDLVAVGKKYNQESVIFVKKTNDPNNPMKAGMIYLNQAKEPEISSTVNPLPKAEDNFYSQHKGRKFRIGF